MASAMNPFFEPPIPLDTIVCAYKNYDELRRKYPKRKVNATVYQEPDVFFYFAKDGSVRTVKMLDNSVWKQDPQSPFYRARIR